MALLVLCTATAGFTQAQTFNLDVTGTFTNGAPLTSYSSPGGTFSADFTVLGDLFRTRSGLFYPSLGTSGFRFSLNGGPALVLDSPSTVFHAANEATPFTGVSIGGARSGEAGVGLSALTSTPFFSGTSGSSAALIPGTYALAPSSEVVSASSDSAPIASGALTVNPVPEPSTLALAASGAALAAAGAFVHRRAKRITAQPGHCGRAGRSPWCILGRKSCSQNWPSLS